MSDFLLDLARRSLGVGPVLKPVIPSLLEPLETAAGGEAWVGEMTTGVQDDRPATQVNAESLSQEAHREKKGEPSLVEHTIERPPTIVDPAAPEVPPVPAPATVPMTAVTRSEVQEHPASEPHPNERMVSRVEIVRERTERIREERTSERHDVEVRTERTIVHDRPVRVPLPATPRLEQPPAPTAGAPARRPDPPVARLRTTIPPPSPAPSREPSQLTPSEPSVRVHIGRVEVRAVFPPAAPVLETRQPQPPPVMTLEEYLKQRGGRG